MTVGLLSIATGAVGNNGRSQVNLDFLQGGGEYPFLNLLKIGQGWAWANNNLTQAMTPDLFDSDGYPTTIVQAGVNVGGITIPTQIARPGNYVNLWTGNGTTTLSGTPVVYSVTAASKATQCIITLASTTIGNGPAPLAVGQEIVVAGATGTGWSILNATQQVAAIDTTGLLITINLNTSAVSGTLGGTITASNTLVTTLGFGRCVFTPTGTTNISFGITVIGSPHITNGRICHVNDEAALNAGQVFGVQFKARLSQAKFGVIRFLNWQNGNGTNTTTWDTANRPQTYYQYQSGQTRIDFLCNSAGSGVTTNSGSDYSVSAPSNWSPSGGLPADKATVHVVWGASSPTTSAVTNTGNNVNWTSHGLQSGNQVIFTDSTGTNTGITVSANAYPFTNLYYVHTVVSANQFTVSLTPGGSDVTITALNCTCRCMPTLNVGSTAAVTVLGPFSNSPSVSGNNYFVGGSKNSLTTLTYDASIATWINQGLSTSAGILQNGVPLALCVRLCNEVGAHPQFISPQFACTPQTDYHTQLATLCKTSGQSWMVPEFEGPNECWNPQFPQTAYASAVATSYGWGASVNDWYGKAISLIGQTANTVYGGSVDGTKYKIVCGCQASTMSLPAANDARLKSTQYVSTQSGSAAYNWVTTVHMGHYMVPWMDGYNQTVPLAFSYFSGTTSAAATYMAGMLGGGVATVSTTTFTMANHGFVANQIAAAFISFGGTFPSPLADAVNYYVLPTVTTNTFQLATSEGGSAISCSGGSGTLYVFPGAGKNAPNVSCQNVLYQNCASWAAGINVSSKVIEFGTYEGGYASGAGYTGNAVTSAITAATQTNPCIVTLPTTSVQGTHTAQSNTNNPAALDGMFLQFASVGGMTQLNGNTYQITKVGVADGLSANQVAINVDATGFSAYTSGGVATYFADNGTTTMARAINNLQYAGKNVAALQTYLTTDYNNMANYSTGAVSGKYPSLFQMGGSLQSFNSGTIPSSNWWSVLEDIYQTPDPPQWLAIMAFNN